MLSTLCVHSRMPNLALISRGSGSKIWRAVIMYLSSSPNFAPLKGRKIRFLSLVILTFDLWPIYLELVPATDQTRLPCEFGTSATCQWTRWSGGSIGISILVCRLTVESTLACAWQITSKRVMFRVTWSISFLVNSLSESVLEAVQDRVSAKLEITWHIERHQYEWPWVTLKDNSAVWSLS